MGHLPYTNHKKIDLDVVCIPPQKSAKSHTNKTVLLGIDISIG